MSDIYLTDKDREDMRREDEQRNALRNAIKQWPSHPKPEPVATLRDQFAMAALTGWIASTRDPEASDWEPRWWAERAYQTADAMLAVREKQP